MTATMTAARTKRKSNGGTSLSIPSGELKRALATVAPAVGGGVRPILANVWIGDGKMVATDLEMRIETPLEGAPDTPVLLPHARLQAIVNAAGAVEDVEIVPSGTTATIRAGRGSWTLPTEDASEFPARSEGRAKPVARLPADQFVSLVNAVKFATDKESSRYALGAVLVRFHDGMLTFVATDGRRMAVAEAEIDQATDNVEKLPPRRLIDVAARLAGGGESVQLEATDREFIAEVDGTRVSSVLVEGRYPEWQDVEPKRTISPTQVRVADLLAACRQAAICTTEDSKGVTFAFTKEGLGLSSASTLAGEAYVTCDVVEAGETTTVKLDPRYVTEWLDCGSFDREEAIEVEAESAQAAVVLRAQQCRCVVMPMAND